MPKTSIIIYTDIHGNDLVFNESSPERLRYYLSRGARVLTPEEIKAAGMEGYETQVCPSNASYDRATNTLTFTPPTPPKPDPHAAAETKIKEILAGSNAAGKAMKARYSDLEIDSWARQEAESMIVLGGDDLPEDSLLPILANANGVDLKTFAMRVMENVKTAEAVTKFIVSRQQALELLVKTTLADSGLSDEEKVAQIEAIEVDYSLDALMGGYSEQA